LTQCVDFVVYKLSAMVDDGDIAFKMCIAILCTLGFILTVHDTSFRCLTRYRLIFLQNGQTALLLVSKVGSTSLAKVLLDAKADVNIANNVRHERVN
jgi:carbon starvation protein CstA